jgi:hypothetical protein
MKAEQLTDVCTYHGEGPMRDAPAGVLRWVDMLNGDTTTSGENLPPGADPQAGAVFHVTPGVRGLPLGTFAG